MAGIRDFTQIIFVGANDWFEKVLIPVILTQHHYRQDLVKKKKKKGRILL